jgi:hypothetical protein
MGYAPKHAKPASLRNTTLKSHHRPFGATDSGRHRTGVVPAPRVPADESIVRGAVDAAEAPAPASASAPAESRTGEGGDAVEGPAVPLQRAALPGS